MERESKRKRFQNSELSEYFCFNKEKKTTEEYYAYTKAQNVQNSFCMELKIPS